MVNHGNRLPRELLGSLPLKVFRITLCNCSWWQCSKFNAAFCRRLFVLQLQFFAFPLCFLYSYSSFWLEITAWMYCYYGAAFCFVFIRKLYDICTNKARFIRNMNKYVTKFTPSWIIFSALRNTFFRNKMKALCEGLCLYVQWQWKCYETACDCQSGNAGTVQSSYKTQKCCCCSTSYR